ncbi:MAG: F0F1 ATP synthase subunit A [Actinobacteria bacterium]|nr:F0F1 ATP synthase subunit A [Actinomycetota bacterium]MTA65636.1 F0F1 ATP synthase subunit A [Actinomycetota bacterium]MTH90607.1 F0F1 ATP synthase subunit A [Actinomycetota bacterium]
MLAFEFPPINELLRWKDVVPGLNKVGLIAIAAALIGSLIFLSAARKDPKVAPKGTRNLAEVIVEFIENNIIMQTMGRDGLGWTPFLLTLFLFVYLCNVPGIIPFIQMPATARMAIPMFLAVLVWVVFNVQGIRHQGPIGYFKNLMFPPGVPKALYILITPIELISTLIIRPFSLAVRLFANMLAGHLLLVIFALLSEALFQARDKILIPIGIFPFFMLVFLTGFEVLVAFLQAYIFTILAAVYISGAVHPEH